MPAGQRISWSMAAMLRDVVFRRLAHAPTINAARHVDHDKRATMVFYFYTCMWLCS